MDIKDLNKQQLILLTLLICFVVSIATGIVTVSLMQKMPHTVPQTINRIIERTIQNVSSPESSKDEESKNTESGTAGISSGEALVNIYANLNSGDVVIPAEEGKESLPEPLGQGVIISEVGLILIDGNILYQGDVYRVKLNELVFQAKILKRFSNGFTVLKIIPKGEESGTTVGDQKATAVDSIQ